MASVSIYNDLVPAFDAMLQDSGNDLKLFYRTCQNLAKKPKEERRMYLDQYLNLNSPLPVGAKRKSRPAGLRAGVS